MVLSVIVMTVFVINSKVLVLLIVKTQMIFLLLGPTVFGTLIKVVVRHYTCGLNIFN